MFSSAVAGAYLLIFGWGSHTKGEVTPIPFANIKVCKSARNKIVRTMGRHYGASASAFTVCVKGK